MFVFAGVTVGIIFYNTENCMKALLTETQALVQIAFIFSDEK